MNAVGSEHHVFVVGETVIECPLSKDEQIKALLDNAVTSEARIEELENACTEERLEYDDLKVRFDNIVRAMNKDAENHRTMIAQAETCITLHEQSLAEMTKTMEFYRDIADDVDHMGKEAARDYSDACDIIDTLNLTIRNILVAVENGNVKGIRDIVVNVEDDIDDETFGWLDERQPMFGGPDVE